MWKDRKAPVYFAATTEFNSFTNVVCWVKRSHKHESRSCPQCVLTYNQHMGGVDLNNQMTRVEKERRHYHWTRRLIIKLFIQTAYNAYILALERLPYIQGPRIFKNQHKAFRRLKTPELRTFGIFMRKLIWQLCPDKLLRPLPSTPARPGSPRSPRPGTPRRGGTSTPSRQQSSSTPSRRDIPLPRRSQPNRAPPEVRLDTTLDHCPYVDPLNTKRIICVVCKQKRQHCIEHGIQPLPPVGKVSIKCLLCGVYLCVGVGNRNCFQAYHHLEQYWLL